MSNQNECKFLVHRESKLNWFRYKVKFIFAKRMEFVKWDEQGYIQEFFVLEDSLALKRTEA